MCSACAALPRTASGSKQRGENPFGRKKADSFRPDIASRDAPRFGNAFRRFSVRRPVSGLVSSGALVQFRPRAACLPIRLTQANSGVWSDPHRLTVAGAVPGWLGALTPRRTGFPFHPARLETERRTPASLIISTPAAVPRDWVTCYNSRPLSSCPTAAVLP